jgi:hypothetical protein
LTQATVGIDAPLMRLQISRTEPTTPPGVSRSMTMASAPESTARLRRRSNVWLVRAVIMPSMVMTARLGA